MTKTMLIVLIAAVVFIVFCVLTIFALLKNHKVVSSFEDKMEESDKTLKRAISDMLAMQERMRDQEKRIKKLEEGMTALIAHVQKTAQAAEKRQAAVKKTAEPEKPQVVNTPRREQPPVREVQRPAAAPQAEEEIYLDDLFDEVQPEPVRPQPKPVQPQPEVINQTGRGSRLEEDMEREARKLRSMLNEYRSAPQAEPAGQAAPPPQQTARTAPRPAAPQAPEYRRPAASGHSGARVGKSGKEYTISDLESLIRE